ncbi:MAG: hypothetical protein FWG51_05235, partial [Firmicutes bacterium]|nr:hypothetical protein [Bacillota bacterium]
SLATNKGSGHLDLAIIMITSDDVVFTASCSSSLKDASTKDELEAPLSEMYQSALKGHSEKPKLILSAAPLLLHQAGDNYVDILSSVSGGVPNFGTLAVDDSVNYENSYVIFNEKFDKNIFSVIAASGNRMLHLAKSAAQNLKDKKNIDINVLCVNSINPIDTKTLSEIANCKIVLIEDNIKNGGLGSLILNYYNQAKISADIKILALSDYVTHGSVVDLLKSRKLDIENISKYFL